jgi:hypothetical protein
MATEEPQTSSVVRVPAEPVIAAVPEDLVVPVARAALAVPEDLVVPAARAVLVVPENLVVPAVRAALVAPEDPVVPAVRAVLVAPENPVVPVALAVRVALANRVAPVALAVRVALANRVALAIDPAEVPERETVQVEAVPGRDQLEGRRRTRSVIAAHHRGQVPVLAAEDSVAVVEITREPAATEAATAWAAAG